jgi:hypothetical protein
MTAAFVQRLRELGWIEGRNITIEYRWADGDTDRLADLVAEFVRLKADVIVTTGTPGRFGAPTTSQDTDLKDAVKFGCHGAFSSDPAGARPAPLEGEARRIATADKVCIPARRGDF